jgi:putative flippase GtrA
MTALYLQVAKYALVGLLNSAVGLLIIYICMAIGINDVLANAAGYALGFCISFSINSIWTFQQTRTTASLLRFLLVTCIAYAGNLATMLVARDVLQIDHRFAQLTGVAVYTLIGFIGARIYAFRARQT